MIPEPSLQPRTQQMFRASELKSPPAAPQLASPMGLELQPKKPQGNVPVDPSREGAKGMCVRHWQNLSSLTGVGPAPS